MDEREVLLAWRNLFIGKQATPDTLAKAEELLDGLSGESPLHLRLASELAELTTGPPAPKTKKRQPVRRAAT